MSVQVQEISKEAIVKVTGNHRAIGRMVVAFNCHYKTVERWIESNDVRLTTPAALQIIQEETGLPIKKILVDSEK